MHDAVVCVTLNDLPLDSAVAGSIVGECWGCGAALVVSPSGQRATQGGARTYCGRCVLNGFTAGLPQRFALAPGATDEIREVLGDGSVAWADQVVAELNRRWTREA